MRAWMAGGALVAALVVGGCADGPTSPTISADEDDYALQQFGTAGYALEGTMGAQGDRPFDGRTGGAQLPAELQLTQEQRDAIKALRDAFRAAHQTELDALRAIFVEAREARRGGATREEVHAILEGGKAIADALRPAVQALHEAILAVFTAEQRAWFVAHRPHIPDGLPRRPGGGRRGPRP